MGYNPSEYLNPDNFATKWDGLPAKGYAEKQYQTGLETGRNSEYVFISGNGTWGARMKDGAQLTTYERIGYHSCTKELLRGLLDSGATFYVYQNGEEYRIK